MNELIGPLGLPGAAASALACVWFGIGIRDKLSRKSEPNGGGTWQANTVAAVAALTGATHHLTQAIQQIGADMSEVKARGAALATREDLTLAAEKNRDAYRNGAQILMGKLDDLQELIREHRT